MPGYTPHVMEGEKSRFVSHQGRKRKVVDKAAVGAVEMKDVGLFVNLLPLDFEGTYTVNVVQAKPGSKKSDPPLHSMRTRDQSNKGRICAFSLAHYPGVDAGFSQARMKSIHRYGAAAAPKEIVFPQMKHPHWSMNLMFGQSHS
jgi:hypothetical protein